MERSFAGSPSAAGILSLTCRDCALVFKLANITFDIASFLRSRRITLMRALTGLHCLTGCLAVVSLATFNPSQIRAENVTSIEEDWQLDVGTPSSARSSPQINCLTSTGAGIESLHVIFLINETGSVGGNLRLQLWNGDQLLATTDVPGTREVLSIPWRTRQLDNAIEH